MAARLTLAVPLAALALAGCGGGDEGGGTEAAPPAPPPADTGVTAPGTTEPEPEPNRCENPEGGYALEFPADWHTNEGDVAPACSFFDPEPLVVPEATDAIQFAVSVSREPAPFDVVTGPSPANEVLEREELTLAGRPAVRWELESTGEGLLSEGIRSYGYAVDLDGETLTSWTYDIEGFDYERNKAVLDGMAASLELTG